MEYHIKIFEEFQKNCTNASLNISEINFGHGYFTLKVENDILHFECVGGGRVNNNKNKQSLIIYGYS